ncbi:glycosyltransferase involved in cell wall biosynthesis [Aminivibrio pyruvatiphilus]|uniref:Glycosyltransferase involved in cell wall biosynthesis n=1 Tax=Aminivibrio pyruvatiphilus TaxID=1005740 RepID=A0A4R8MGH9_9BACT|nr:glycosyltransferase family 4 protein [Aminivibrio pyruvatiphilus]TDY65109.1 glycosyltransferase involved in cell wall biosynthesis [Aminivibrio pyruvatiphilus]
MKIIHILPELEEGGVERHVLWLTEELSFRGHDVTVISSGGKMVSRLASGVNHLALPVDVKNPLTAFFCARKIARLAARENVQLLHAHSRVPAWVAYWASRMAKIPFVVTAHGVFSNKTAWIYRPYRKAERVICVSSAVKRTMEPCFGNNTTVILNGMPEKDLSWKGSKDGMFRFLFIGRLSPVKGIQDIVEILPLLQGDWTLDVVGNGPLFSTLSAKIKELALNDRVFLHGFRDDTDRWLSECSCLLFPSYTEGMPLTLARAVQMGVPVLASSIPPVIEMAETEEGLLPPGEKDLWRRALQGVLEGNKSFPRFSSEKIPTIKKMTDEVEAVYAEVSCSR